jgi:hypothetical protein
MPALLAGMMLLYAAVTTIVVLTLPQGSEANVVVNSDRAGRDDARCWRALRRIEAAADARREFIAAGLAWAAAEVI